MKPGQPKPTGPPSGSFERARAVKQMYEKALLALPGVVGVGVGLRQRRGSIEDEIALVVMVRRKLPEAHLETEERLPREIDGVPVDVQAVGDVTAQDE